MKDFALIKALVGESLQGEELHQKILHHPTREFLQAWKAHGIERPLKVFILKNGTAVQWTMATNFDEKQFVLL